MVKTTLIFFDTAHQGRLGTMRGLVAIVPILLILSAKLPGNIITVFSFVQGLWTGTRFFDAMFRNRRSTSYWVQLCCHLWVTRWPGRGCFLSWSETGDCWKVASYGFLSLLFGPIQLRRCGRCDQDFLTSLLTISSRKLISI